MRKDGWGVRVVCRWVNWLGWVQIGGELDLMDETGQAYTRMPPAITENKHVFVFDLHYRSCAAPAPQTTHPLAHTVDSGAHKYSITHASPLLRPQAGHFQFLDGRGGVMDAICEYGAVPDAVVQAVTQVGRCTCMRGGGMGRQVPASGACAPVLQRPCSPAGLHWFLHTGHQQLHCTQNPAVHRFSCVDSISTNRPRLCRP